MKTIYIFQRLPQIYWVQYTTMLLILSLTKIKRQLHRK